MNEPMRILALAGALFAVGMSAHAQATCDGISEVVPSDLVKIDVVDGLPGRPLFLTSPPGDRDRRYILDQDGRILLHRRGDPSSQHTVALDLRSVVGGLGNEAGLLGMAFDPDFDPDAPGDDHFWVNYTEPLDQFGLVIRTVVARYRMDPTDPDVADPASGSCVLTIDQPQTNHNGGWIAFGPDGYLYVATGDGGSGGDPHGQCGNGQDTDNLLGGILRIDVRGVSPDPRDPECGSVASDCSTITLTYDVPGENPFVDGSGCDELWAYGLRNPWRPSFDRATDDLYVADVGQGCWEEVNWVDFASAGGANFGWRQMEGEHCYDGVSCDPANVACAGSPDCFDPSLTLPVAEYVNSQQVSGEGCSVTGGYAYRGCRMPSLHGTYFYGDYCTGFVRSFRMAGGVATDPRDWTATLGVGGGNSLTSFGEDQEGELYIVERTGAVSKILAPLVDFEVSGGGADAFLPHRDSDWTWEDLAYTSEHRLAAYRVYRGVPGGTPPAIRKLRTKPVQ